MAELRAAVVYDCLFPLDSGGGERVYRRMADSLVERGASVDYVTRRQWPRGQAPLASFSVVGVWEGPIHDSYGTRTASSAVRFALAVFKYFLKSRREYDFVIASALPVLTLLAARAALFGSDTKVVADWLEVWTWRKWRSYAGSITGSVAYILQYLGLRSTRHHTVNSQFTRQRVVALQRKTRPIVLGLVDSISPSADFRHAATPPFALFVGRLIPDKRVATIPASIAQARQRIPSLRAVIVGEGPASRELQIAIDASGLTDEIEVRGKVSDDELDELMASAAVLVNPSVREGFGLVVVEAAAHGVPSVVVAGQDNASVALISSGINGFVAPDHSPDAMGSALVRAVEGGASLRSSTRQWFLRARLDRGLTASMDAIVNSLGFTWPSAD